MRNSDNLKELLASDCKYQKIKKKIQRINEDMDKTRALAKRIKYYFQFLLGKSKENEICDYSNGQFNLRRIVIAAKREYKKRYYIIVYELSTQLFFKLVSKGGEDYIRTGSIDQYSPIAQYEIDDCIEIKISGPIIYNRNIYFVVNDDSVKLIEKKTTILKDTNYTSIDEFIDFAQNNHKNEMNTQPNGFFLLRLTGAKIFKHRKNQDVFQLMIAGKEKFKYRPQINDSRFCREEYAELRFKGRALVEVRTNQSGDMLCLVQTMFGHVISELVWKGEKDKERQEEIDSYEDCPFSEEEIEEHVASMEADEQIKQEIEKNRKEFIDRLKGFIKILRNFIEVTEAIKITEKCNQAEWIQWKENINALSELIKVYSPSTIIETEVVSEFSDGCSNIIEKQSALNEQVIAETELLQAMCWPEIIDIKKLIIKSSVLDRQLNEILVEEYKNHTDEKIYEAVQEYFEVIRESTNPLFKSLKKG